MKNNIPYEKVKDVLITRTAIKTLKPEQIVEKVISFQFRDAREHTRMVDEIEISGFGKFIRSKAKTARKLNKLNAAKERLLLNLQDDDRSIEQKEAIREKLSAMEISIQFLQDKYNKDENRFEGNS